MRTPPGRESRYGYRVMLVSTGVIYQRWYLRRQRPHALLRSRGAMYLDYLTTLHSNVCT